MRIVLALAWGVLAAVPLLREAGRAPIVARVRALRAGASAGAVPVPGRRRRRREARLLEDELPLTADLLAVAVTAGLTPYLALGLAVRSGPPAVAARLAAVRGAADAGGDLAGALEAEAGASPALRPLLEALLVSERVGAPIGPVLDRLAVGARAHARRVALSRARRVPVRLLFPLVFLVLPAFLLLTVAPVALAALAR